MLLCAFIAAPVFVLLDQLRRRRLRKLRGEHEWRAAHGVRVEAEVLVIVYSDRVDRLPLDTIQQATVHQVTGDAGFAHANSLCWLIRVVQRDGTSRCIEHAESFPHPFEREVLAPLRARGVCSGFDVLQGPGQGLAVVMLYGAALLWLLLACFIASAVVRVD